MTGDLIDRAIDTLEAQCPWDEPHGTESCDACAQARAVEKLQVDMIALRDSVRSLHNFVVRSSIGMLARWPKEPVVTMVDSDNGADDE